MNDESPPSVPRRFVTCALPWLAGAIGFLLYLVTLNRWVSLYNLTAVSRAEGWIWTPELQHPLISLTLYPFSWLPASAIPLALNLAAALAASLVLVLLARSVALLRHDVADPLVKGPSPSILSTPNAWIPPVLAATVCGLQLSFWEHATSFTGNMLDLLVFAYVIRCLLEFRIDQNQAWFSRAALVYGLGMTNDWALVGYLPILISAMVWISGFHILYDKRWLLRTIAWGFAGLSLYLLLPFLQSITGQADMTFWAALKANVKSQKEALILLRRPAFRVLAFTSLLPVIVLSIRWKSHTLQFNDDTRLGVFLTKLTVHFLHALFLFCAVWMALDPSFSPRHLGLGTPMLTYYYTVAIVAGYCAGHFLLMGTGEVRPGLARGAGAVVYLLVFSLPLAMVWRNWGQIATTNGPELRQFVRNLYDDLPAGKSVALSDDPREVFLLEAELAAHKKEKDVMVLDAASLPFVGYQKFMARRFATRWPIPTPTNKVETVGPAKVIRLLFALARQEPVLFLHPSAGMYFERSKDRPSGLVHFLQPRADLGTDNSDHQEGLNPGWNREIADPTGGKLDTSTLLTNEQLWQKRWESSLRKLAENVSSKPKTSRLDGLAEKLLLTEEKNFISLFLGVTYARSLDYWGVQMQRSDNWEAANSWFNRAIELNPQNVSAQINADYNRRRQNGEKQRLEAASLKREFHDLFATYGSWREILNANGPVDEPTVLFEMGKALLETGNSRQATAAFARCSELAPNWTEPKVWVALGLLDLRRYTDALDLSDRVAAAAQVEDANTLSKLLLCRTTALQGLGRTNDSRAGVEAFAQQYRDRKDVLSVALDLFSQNAQFDPALALVSHMLTNDPANLRLLAKKGWIEVELSHYEAAIRTLATVTSRAPADENARLNLAIAKLGAKQFDAAQADYQQLLTVTKNSRNALFGLAGIAWHKHETNTAVNLYQQYLSNGVPESAQYALAVQRLRILTGDK